MTKQNINRNMKSSAGLIARFGQDRSGNMTMLFALMAVVMTLTIGAAVDLGRWLHARDQTSGAIDAAVLAGARHLQSNSTDTSGAIAAAKSFYVQNVTSRIPVLNDSVAFSVSSNGSAVTASGNAYIKTPFLQLAHIDKLPLLTNAQAATTKVPPMEIAVMLDITGSMGECIDSGRSCSTGSKLEALKDSLIDTGRNCQKKDESALICMLLPQDSAGNNAVKVAVVPFSEDVRLPTTAVNAARGTSLSKCEWLSNGTVKGTSCTNSVSGATKYVLSPCVVERSGNNKYTDAAPGSGNYVLGHYSSSSTGSGNNVTGNCTVPSSSEMMPLSTNRSTLISKINGLSAAGGTAGHIGSAWAWYTLSPNWNTLWPSNGAAPYGTSDLTKIAVLMTDGDYNTQYDKNGVKSTNPPSASVCGAAQPADPGAGPAVNGACAGSQALSLCTAMKAKGIVVYTIGFNIGGSSTPAYQLLSQCATDTTKFYAPVTNDQLKQTFGNIGFKLSQLYLSQ